MTDVQNSVIESHYTTQSKVKRPKLSVAEPPATLPKHNLFSEKEANQKINNINNDIYVGTQKEKTKHDLNRNLYFKIFGGVALLTAGIAGYDKIKKFFRKS